MAPKRSKSGANSTAGQRWEQGLLSAPFVEEVSFYSVFGTRLNTMV